MDYVIQFVVCIALILLIVIGTRQTRPLKRLQKHIVWCANNCLLNGISLQLSDPTIASIITGYFGSVSAAWELWRQMSQWQQMLLVGPDSLNDGARIRQPYKILGSSKGFCYKVFINR